ncbi:hypothetical protein T484DRAFT_1923303 [Baffinella frigidus]|nr:hypothetical protein T484DRAFT_1923303 [Cryptophyta sp. CCMP2293]
MGPPQGKRAPRVSPISIPDPVLTRTMAALVLAGQPDAPHPAVWRGSAYTLNP